MRKEIVAHPAQATDRPITSWMDLASLARVRLTSEDPTQPIELALQDAPGIGWKAAQPGPQTLWLHFDRPQAIREIQLRFETTEPRTQEFVLLWSSDGGESYREIVRQQFNFSPQAAPSETENYLLQLANVTDLKLTIIPDISGGNARASLQSLRVR